MKPEVVRYNSVSLDGWIFGFEVNMGSTTR